MPSRPGTDFIRTAIRNQLNSQSEEVSRSIDRHTLEVGLLELGVVELAAGVAAGEMLHVKVVGLVRIASDVTPAFLALQTIGSLTVLGALQASQQIKAALARKDQTAVRSRQERTSSRFELDCRYRRRSRE